MDHLDKKIINMLEDNARITLKSLAQEVFLSSPAVSARIERLSAEGIIKNFSANVDEDKLGFPIKAFINLEMDPVLKPEFYPFIDSCPNVLECDCVTGIYSMLIKVCFTSTLELDTFIGHLQEFGKTETQIVFSTPVKHRGINITAISTENDEDTPETDSLTENDDIQ